MTNPITDADLDRIEASMTGTIIGCDLARRLVLTDLPAVVAALREAWAEDERLRAVLVALHNARQRKMMFGRDDETYQKMKYAAWHQVERLIGVAFPQEPTDNHATS